MRTDRTGNARRDMSDAATHNFRRRLQMSSSIGNQEQSDGGVGRLGLPHSVLSPERPRQAPSHSQHSPPRLGHFSCVRSYIWPCLPAVVRHLLLIPQACPSLAAVRALKNFQVKEATCVRTQAGAAPTARRFLSPAERRGRHGVPTARGSAATLHTNVGEVRAERPARAVRPQHDVPLPCAQTKSGGRYRNARAAAQPLARKPPHSSAQHARPARPAPAT